MTNPTITQKRAAMVTSGDIVVLFLSFADKSQNPIAKAMTGTQYNAKIE